MSTLLISPYFSPATGGVETHLDDLCSYFDSRKEKVYVRTYKALSTKSRGQTNEKRGTVSIHRLWWPDFNLNFKLESSPVLRFLYVFSGLFIDCWLFLLSNSKKINVIQAHGFIAAVMAVLLGKAFNKRVVINTHVGFKFEGEGIMKKILRWTLMNSDEILVLTDGAKQSIKEVGIPENKISIYHYWVDQKVFTKQANAKKNLGWEGKFVVLFVGRLVKVKGVLTIFELAKTLKDVQFKIAGTGPLTDEIKQQSEPFNNVEFLGKISNKELPIYYSGADLLLVPSLVIKQEYEEGIPRVIIEALSCGLPIISTKSGGIPYVFSKEIGRLVEDDARSIKTAIHFYYTHPRELSLLTKSCRPFALKHFSIKNAQIIENSLHDA